MPFYEENHTFGTQMLRQIKLNQTYNHNEDVVFSAGGGYNPTNLAIRASLQEVFDAFMDPVSEELRLYSEELKDDDAELS